MTSSPLPADAVARTGTEHRLAHRHDHRGESGRRGPTGRAVDVPVSRRAALGLGAVVLGAGSWAARPEPAWAAAGEARTILKPTPEDLFVLHGTNAEMRWDAARDQGYLIDNARFFVRNHTATPRVDARSWRLRVYGDGLRDRPGPAQAHTLSLARLRSLPRRTVTAALECTGNGRSFFDTQQGTPASGTAWTLGAIGVARWTGVPLRTVLESLGLRAAAVDVMAVGLDAPFVSGGRDYGHVRRPIPVDKAMDDALLVYEMNGQPLPRDHGFPVRLVVPGWIGIASVKWLGSLRVSTRPLYSPWNTDFYRMTGGDYPPDSPPLTGQVVKSAFELASGANLAPGRAVTLHGRSWSGHAAVRRVEVSTDGGTPWRLARLGSENPAQAWARWTLPWTTPTATGPVELLARATDTTGRRQPDVTPFNNAGYHFDAVVRHPVTIAAPGRSQRW